MEITLALLGSNFQKFKYKNNILSRGSDHDIIQLKNNFLMEVWVEIEPRVSFGELGTIKGSSFRRMELI